MRLANRRMASPQNDLGLDALQFQYARYLHIAGSRENSPLPMTFTGIWNDRRWGVHIGYDDFHLDPDTQMNYWPAEVANVSESHEPLFKLIASWSSRGAGPQRSPMVAGAGWLTR